jgi:hypothetical protein
LIPIAEVGAVVPLRIVFGIRAPVLPADFGFDTDSFVAAILCVGVTMSNAAAKAIREVRFIGLRFNID